MLKQVEFIKPFLFTACSNIPVLISAFLFVMASSVFSGCYTLNQGAVMLGYLNRAVPLETLASSECVDDRAFAQMVENIRRFAIEELGLSASRNYTSYVAIERDYLAAVVSASPEDSFAPYEWWFPIVGRMPYKGFFNSADAQKERLRLEKKGLDTWVRRVDAFSTLGWFRDPLYSYMKNYSERNLADLIIHELTHATVFLKNHVQFNEELAVFVGSEGARLYMEKSLSESETKNNSSIEEIEADAYRADFDLFLAFVRSLISELEDLYSGGFPREETMRRKDAIIESAKQRFSEQYDDLFQTENFRGFSSLPVNNAYLSLFRLYYEEDQYFRDIFEKSGAGLHEFIAAAKTLNGLSRLNRGRGNPREELETALDLR